MKDLIANLAALIKVKTVVTFACVAIFCVLALRGSIEPDSVMTITMCVISFYFGTQKVKEHEDEE